MSNIKLVQMNVVAGNIQKNIENMFSVMKSSYDEIVIFPEMCVGGYFIGDLYYDEGFLKELEHAHHEIKSYSKDRCITTIFGSVIRNNERTGEDGRPILYNQLIAYDIMGYYTKNCLEHRITKTNYPNYRYFDDKRYFTKNDSEHKCATLRDDAYTLSVCEDMWDDDYNNNVLTTSSSEKAIINISASPYTEGKNKARERVISKLYKDINIPLIYVNNVGCQNNGKNLMSFDGDSAVYNSNGIRVNKKLKPFEEGVIEINLDELVDSKYPKYRSNTVSQIEMKFKSIIESIKHFDGIIGQRKYVIGVSGGIDSALMLVLLEQAIGSDRILAYNLPTKYNGELTKLVAQKICDELSIELKTIPIQDLVDANHKTLKNAGVEMTDLMEENIQARIRGTSILMNIAGLVGGVMTNNANKVETALGYTTIYGDQNGIASFLGDLTKVEIFEMARCINQSHEIIPEEIICDEIIKGLPYNKNKMYPSAELSKDQVDPIKYGYHDAIIKAHTKYMRKTPYHILNWYLDGTLEENLGVDSNIIKYWHIDNPQMFIDDLKWVFKQISINTFKRIQAPPITITSPSAYGVDIRESQLPFSWNYDELEREILYTIKNYYE